MDIQVGEAGWRNESFGDSQQGKMFVFFYVTQRKNNFKSLEAKRPIFEDKIFIKKLVPGDNKLVIDRPMREAEMEEFPVEWARFEQKKAAIVSGTPIEAWPILSDIQKAEFKALNIFTIDQFASLADSVGNNIMGFNDLRAKAQAFIKASNDSQFMDQVRSETDAKLAAQDKEMAELRAQIAAMSGKPAKKKREWTPEQRAAAAERMKKMHTDKQAA